MEIKSTAVLPKKAENLLKETQEQNVFWELSKGLNAFSKTQLNDFVF